MRLFSMMVALLLATTVLAADKEPVEKSKNADQQKTRGLESVKKKQAPVWPRPYKSTEEISVDSTVPFPTDI